MRARPLFYFLFGLLVATAASTIAAAQPPTAGSPHGGARSKNAPADSLGTDNPLDNLTSKDKERLYDIIRLVGKPEVPITPSVRGELWRLLDKACGGSATPSEVTLMRDMMVGAATVYIRYFYEDALEAYKTRRPFKSLEREQYEKRLLKLGVMADFRVAQNERLIEQIAAHKPISTEQGDVLMDDARIRRILANLDVAGQRAKLLFTRP